jgi:hypothetical protein
LDALLAMHSRSANEPPVPNAQQEPHWPAAAGVTVTSQRVRALQVHLDPRCKQRIAAIVVQQKMQQELR